MIKDKNADGAGVSSYQETGNTLIAGLREEIKKLGEKDFYISHVAKGKWPEAIGTCSSVQLPTWEITDNLKVGQTIRTYKLQRRCVLSAYFDIDNGYEWRAAVHSMAEVSLYVLKTKFRDSIIGLCDNRFVVREFTKDLIPKGLDSIDPIPATESLHRRVNFWGKVVSPYVGTRNMAIINPKYKKAAKQIVGFHPDICCFLFLDPEKWEGDFTIVNGIGSNKSQISAIYQCAAEPRMTYLGYVFTVIPKGFKGFLWYWIWKLLRFVP